MLLIDEEFLPQATALIGMAHRRIDIATFKAEITSKPRGRRLRIFFDTLFKKREAGVQINFLINWHSNRRVMPACNISTLHELKRHLIFPRVLPGNRCCHAKILIVDQSKAIVGSHNLSVKSCHNNFEVSYLIWDKVHVARLSDVFEHALLNSIMP